MVGVDDALQWTAGQLVGEAEAVRQGRGLIDRIIPESPAVAFPLRPQPVLVEAAHAEVAPDFAEGVHVAVAGAAPVAKLDA